MGYLTSFIVLVPFVLLILAYLSLPIVSFVLLLKLYKKLKKKFDL